MYQRKRFRVSVRTNQVSQGFVILTAKADHIFNEKEALEYARMCLLPSDGYCHVFINGQWAWQGYFNKSYASRLQNQRTKKLKALAGQS